MTEYREALVMEFPDLAFVKARNIQYYFHTLYHRDAKGKLVIENSWFTQELKFFRDELFAKRLVSAISKGGDHISLTLTEKGAIAFARELSDRLLAEKSQKHESGGDDQEELIPKSEVMKMLSVSSTTLWLWNNNKYLPQVNIGRKVFYRAEDIQKLRKGNTNVDSAGSI